MTKQMLLYQENVYVHNKDILTNLYVFGFFIFVMYLFSRKQKKLERNS